MGVARGMVVAMVLFAAACGRPAPELPKLAALPDFALTTQAGAPITKAAFLGRVTVVNFIFTSCPTICPMLTERAKELQSTYADEPDIHIVSFSVDPAKDTPAVLTAYGEKHGADPNRWTFVTGDAAAVGNAVEYGFKVAVGKPSARPDGTYDILHASHFILVDHTATIRGFYPSDEDGMKRLVADSLRLRKEIP